MPVITLEAGKLNKEQKSQIVKEFTATASKVMNVPEQAFIVQIKENEQDNIGVGGKLLSDR
ncbi:tautomerase family protein [Clostridium sp. 19966]|uniref:4-oxalocrotonate tautomerase DmpI n=1 Tax=Clostridium sp. 19966 TaxID=2768166 RepID=UPI0028DF8DC9|nr:4-oxalocrotonate tautomerase DmpI [Clostridium sp. 19966]MDT8716956.1 tautomerase family protein [Clostridium sp. 19966]